VKWVEIDVLHSQSVLVGTIQLAPSFGPSDRGPLRCLVARPSEPARLDEGLEEHRRVAIGVLPVRSEPAGDPGRDGGCEARDAHLRQDQEAGVADHEMKVGFCVGASQLMRASRGAQLHADAAKPSAPRTPERLLIKGTSGRRTFYSNGCRQAALRARQAAAQPPALAGGPAIVYKR